MQTLDRTKTLIIKSIQVLKPTLIVLAVIILFRWLLFEPYKINSSSMEGELIDGDYVLISKCEYGSRFPDVIKIPFISYDNPIFRAFEIKSYVNLNISYLRLPGFSHVKQGDVVAFFLPVERKELASLKTIYVKRCIGLPGDTLKISGQTIIRNDRAIEPTPNVQHRYHVVLKQPIESIAADIGIKSPRTQITALARNENNTQFEYTALINASTVSKLKNHPAILSLTERLENEAYVDLNIYPNSMMFKWNLDSIGPFVVPFKGFSVKLSRKNVALYGRIIKDYEDLPNVSLHNGKMDINGTAIEEYTFTKAYYYMVGDNRRASYDSRYWGVVPEDHILGRVCRVIHSKTRPLYGIFSAVK